MITIPMEVLDAAGLDAEMRAIAEMAASGSEQRAALPPVEMDPAERAMEEQPQVESADIWIEELPDLPAPGGGNALTPDDASTEVYQHEGESTPSEAEAAAEGKLQIKGWASGAPELEISLAGMMCGQPTSEDLPENPLLIVRYPDGTLHYIRTGGIFADNASLEFHLAGSDNTPVLQLKNWHNPSSYGANATIAKFLEGKQQFNHTLLVPVRNSYTGDVGYVDIGQLSDTGGIEVGTPKTVVTNVEWVDSSHADFGQHPYTFKISRGNLSISGGKLSVVADASLTTYIGTTPLSQEVSSS